MFVSFIDLELMYGQLDGQFTARRDFNVLGPSGAHRRLTVVTCTFCLLRAACTLHHCSSVVVGAPSKALASAGSPASATLSL